MNFTQIPHLSPIFGCYSKTEPYSIFILQVDTS